MVQMFGCPVEYFIQARLEQRNSMDFKTWLLFNELPNESLENVIRKRLEVYSKIDLDYRIPVSLNVLHGKAILKTLQPNLLAETVIKKKKYHGFFSAAESTA